MQEQTQPSTDDENQEIEETVEEKVEEVVEEEIKDEVVQPSEAEPARKSWKDAVPGSEPSLAAPEEGKPSRHIGRWALILLLTLVIGFAAAYFALVLPAQQELRQVKTDLAAAQEKLEEAETELASVSSDLDQTLEDLTAAEYSLALARVQANVAYARASLISRDLLTARQEVSAAVTNLQVLLPYVEDKEISNALSERMDVIDKAVYTDSATALEELRTLSENLLRLSDQ